FPVSNESAEVRTIPNWSLHFQSIDTPTLAPNGLGLIERDQGIQVIPDRTVKSSPVRLSANDALSPTACPIFSPRGDLVAWGDVSGLVTVADWRKVQSWLAALGSGALPARAQPK